MIIRTASTESRLAPQLASVVALLIAPLLLIACSNGSGPDPEPDLGPEPGSVAMVATVPPDDEPPAVVVTDPGSDPASDPAGVLPVTAVRAYRPNSPVADVLKGCVLVNTVADSCSFGALSPISSGAGVPTVDAILDRVLVTHDWMGDRFADVLQRSPDSLLYLFGSATSILIGSDVRPSFYTTLNGGIQLDPDYLWTTVAEKQTVSIEDDYRRGFGSDLTFWGLRSRRLNGERAWDSFSLQDDSTRTVDELFLPLAALLYHELAHANDYLPRSSLPMLDTTLPIRDAIRALDDLRISSLMQNESPLQSSFVLGLAEVRYRDAEPYDYEIDASAEEVGAAFEPDGGVSFYSYSTEYEDVANLVEAALMGYNHNVTTNVAFTSRPADADNYGCDELLTGWGVYHRLADPNVAFRAQRVMSLMTPPDSRLDGYLAGELGVQSLMTPGLSWCQNLELTPDTSVPVTVTVNVASGSEASAVAEPLASRRWSADGAGGVTRNAGHSQRAMLRENQLSR